VSGPEARVCPHCKGEGTTTPPDKYPEPCAVCQGDGAVIFGLPDDPPLTKRERFAVEIYTAFIANHGERCCDGDLMERACSRADALIAELEVPRG